MSDAALDPGQRCRLRLATAADAERIVVLLEQLAYHLPADIAAANLAGYDGRRDRCLVADHQQAGVIALLSLHLLPMLAHPGPFARIGFFCVDRPWHGGGLGGALLREAERQARDAGCIAVELHCHQRRVDAQRFYRRHGYLASPRYLIKRLGEDHQSPLPQTTAPRSDDRGAV